MFIGYNPNPVRADSVGDCAVRAIAKALDITWEQAYAKLSATGFVMGDMPSSNVVIGAVLRKSGFKRKALPNECPDCYTVNDFLVDNPVGTFVLFSEGHVATAIDGILFDSWDSSNRVPIVYWYKEDKE